MRSVVRTSSDTPSLIAATLDVHSLCFLHSKTKRAKVASTIKAPVTLHAMIRVVLYCISCRLGVVSCYNNTFSYIYNTTRALHPVLSINCKVLLKLFAFMFPCCALMHVIQLPKACPISYLVFTMNE